MKNFLLVTLCIYLLINPFYIFRSGIPQPSDMIVAFAGLVFLLSGKSLPLIKELPIIKYLIRLVLLITSINLIYWFYYQAVEGIPNTIFFTSLYYIFNALCFVLVLYLFKDRTKSTINIVSFFIILSLFIQVSLALLGIQGGNREEGSRPTLFFNNPNQLGYYALLMLTLFTMLPSSFRKNKISVLLVIGFSIYLVLYSGSRAALSGILLLAGLIIFIEGFKFNLASLLVLVIALISLPIFLETTFVQNRILLLEARSARYAGTSISEAQVRGYDRFWIHPEYIFYGAGEGLFSRFKSFHNLEIHSGLGNILFSYGILGASLFAIFLYKTVEENKFYNLLLLAPILVYNVTHQGLRDPLFWTGLAIIYLTARSKLRDNNIEPGLNTSNSF